MRPKVVPSHGLNIVVESNLVGKRHCLYYAFLACGLSYEVLCKRKEDGVIFLQSLKNTLPLLWEKRIMLWDLSTIEYAVPIRTNDYWFSLENCAWSIAWNIHVLLYKIHMKATITFNQ